MFRNFSLATQRSNPKIFVFFSYTTYVQKIFQRMSPHHQLELILGCSVESHIKKTNKKNLHFVHSI